MKKIKVLLIVLAFGFFSFLGCLDKSNTIQSAAPSQVTKISLASKSLEKNMNVNIYLPKGYSKKNKYPVLYMLHGYTDNEDAWMPNLKLKETADRLIDADKITPLIIVMPQIDNSFGVNSDKYIYMSLKYSAGMYEDYLYKDVISYIDKNYSTYNDKKHRYIGGLSMGGFAALHLAFRHTDLFSKVGGHSPAIIDDMWLYPSDEIKKERELISLALKANLKSMKVYLDCGDRDSFKFYVGCEQLFALLQAKAVSSEYHLNSGEHNGDYWRSNGENYLLFYAGK